MKQAKFFIIFGITISSFMVLLGCGQSGRLYLPEKPIHSNIPPANESNK